MPIGKHISSFNYEVEHKAMAVIEKYFDVDIDNADAAYDVLVDNEVHPEVANAIATGMFPSEG